MNYFLILLILGLGGGGYYEYTILEQKAAADQQQLTSLSGKIDGLQSENKKLEDDKTQLTKTVADDQAEMTKLSAQTQTVQSTLAEAKMQAAHPSKSATPAVPTLPSNNLGTIVTLDGKTFRNCQLLKVEADGIVVNQSDGIIKISFGLMQPDLQKRFGYDPHQAAALTEDQVQFQEQQRQAAAQASGN
jgi:cell division protein FtsB